MNDLHTSAPTSPCMVTSTYLPRPPKFLRALYDILTYEPTHILTWAPCGSFFQVLDIPQLEQHVLPKYFKHNKFASFQRQLNNFGFRKWTKTRASVCTFSHDSLVRCAPSELAAMVVRCGVVSPHSTHSTSGAAGMGAVASPSTGAGAGSKTIRNEPEYVRLGGKRPRSCSSDSTTGYTTDESEVSSLFELKKTKTSQTPNDTVANDGQIDSDPFVSLLDGVDIDPLDLESLPCPALCDAHDEKINDNTSFDCLLPTDVDLCALLMEDAAAIGGYEPMEPLFDRDEPVLSAEDWDVLVHCEWL